MENKLTEEQIETTNRVMSFQSRMRWKAQELQQQGMSQEEAEKEAFSQIREIMYKPQQQENN